VVHDLGPPLGGVVGPDVAVGHLERGPQLARDGIEGGADLGRRHPKVVEAGPVEALGQPPQRLVAVLAHLGQDGPDLVHRRLGLSRGAGQAAAEVVGVRHPGAPQVESA
jgi:hypothetical protein